MPFTEENSYAPNSPYASSKAGADHIVRAYQKTYNLATTISNCSNNYGPRQHSEKLIPKIIQNCFAKREIPIYGSGQQIRDWLFVTDHCVAINKILQHAKIGEKYNIGSNNEITNLVLAHKICDIFNNIDTKFNHQKLITHVADRPGHDFRYAVDATKMKKQLQWQATTNFTQALLETIEFYKN